MKRNSTQMYEGHEVAPQWNSSSPAFKRSSISRDVRGTAVAPWSSRTKPVPTVVDSHEIMRDFTIGAIPSDLTVIVENKSKITEFRVHKSNLAAVSRVFARLIKFAASEQPVCSITLQDEEPETIRNFLLLIYRPANFSIVLLTAKHYDNLLDFVARYEALGLLDTIEDQLDKHMGIHYEGLSFYYVAIKHGFDELAKGLDSQIVRLEKRKFEEVLGKVRKLNLEFASKLESMRRIRIEEICEEVCREFTHLERNEPHWVEHSDGSTCSQRLDLVDLISELKDFF